mmetsp:Transcript_15875/g.36658  ORF Transcript_15875/g.36658 Transcript_15875/m.36658 type:complete len:325 (+) Transcript_15875:713-1687(+)
MPDPCFSAPVRRHETPARNTRSVVTVAAVPALRPPQHRRASARGPGCNGADFAAAARGRAAEEEGWRPFARLGRSAGHPQQDGGGRERLHHAPGQPVAAGVGLAALWSAGAQPHRTALARVVETHAQGVAVPRRRVAIQGAPLLAARRHRPRAPRRHRSQLLHRLPRPIHGAVGTVPMEDRKEVRGLLAGARPFVRPPPRPRTVVLPPRRRRVGPRSAQDVVRQDAEGVQRAPEEGDAAATRTRREAAEQGGGQHAARGVAPRGVEQRAADGQARHVGQLVPLPPRPPQDCRLLQGGWGAGAAVEGVQGRRLLPHCRTVRSRAV